jgi:hypothetical protein
LKLKKILTLLFVLCALSGHAQDIKGALSQEELDSFLADEPLKTKQVDLVDIARRIALKDPTIRSTEGEIRTSKLRVSGVPAAGYTLQTGFAAVVSANGSFYTDTGANISNVLSSFTYTVRNQIIFPIQTNIWTPGNKYNIVLDWRYLYFPSYTYGLGQYTTPADGYLINYSTVHLHQTILREISHSMYAGIGYNVDYYWNISELDPPAGKITDLQSYGLTSTEYASGITFNYLYDDRKNCINPENGNFVNVIYRPNLTLFGNAANWRSLVIDLRKYINLPAGSSNVLAFWNYNWLTLDGKPPYLMLPATGADPYSNTGRGYIQGRFRGDNMLYAEAEYRFALSTNGLFGGVIFANAQSFTMQPANKFGAVTPGWAYASNSTNSPAPTSRSTMVSAPMARVGYS